MVQPDLTLEETQRVPIQDTSGGFPSGTFWTNVPDWRQLLSDTPETDGGQEEEPVPTQAQTNGPGYMTSAERMYDFAIFYSEESKNELISFVRFLERRFVQRLRRQPRIWASDLDLDGIGEDVMRIIEHGLNNSRHYLLYINRTFTGNRWSEFQKDQCFHKYFHGETKKLIVPIQTEKNLKMPFGTETLRPIEFWRITRGQTMEAFLENGTAGGDERYLQTVLDWFFKTTDSNQLSAEGVVQEMGTSPPPPTQPAFLPLGGSSVVTDGPTNPVNQQASSASLLPLRHLPESQVLNEDGANGEGSTEPATLLTNTNPVGIIQNLPAVSTSNAVLPSAPNGNSPQSHRQHEVPDTDQTILKSTFSSTNGCNVATVKASTEPGTAFSTSASLGAVQATALEVCVNPDNDPPSQNAPSLAVLTASSAEKLQASDLRPINTSEERQQAAPQQISSILPWVCVISGALLLGYIIGRSSRAQP